MEAAIEGFLSSTKMFMAYIISEGRTNVKEKTQENNQTMIVYDYLHMRVKQMQKKGLLWHIDIPEVT